MKDVQQQPYRVVAAGGKTWKIVKIVGQYPSLAQIEQDYAREQMLATLVITRAYADDAMADTYKNMLCGPYIGHSEAYWAYLRVHAGQDIVQDCNERNPYTQKGQADARCHELNNYHQKPKGFLVSRRHFTLKKGK